jgi:AmmeMemoRadiSam system protein B
VTDIQLILMRMQKGLLVSSEEVRRVVAELDKSFLLDSERYREARGKLLADYSAQSVRKAFLAGSAYPDSASELAEYLDSILSLNTPPAPGAGIAAIRALAAPHIDIEAGKRAYARAYQAVREQKPRRIVFLGTGHHLQDGFLSLTGKDFETPFGLVQTDQAAVSELIQAAGKTAAGEDFVHRSEHSIEFQMIFCRHLFGEKFTAIPILCGGFESLLDDVSRAGEIEGIDNFLVVLNRMVRNETEPTLVVAGVDFSHIGPKFGHDRQGSSMIPQTRIHDSKLISALCDCDAEGFWAAVREDRNLHNVCGFSPLAVLLELVSGTVGRRLDYDIWEEAATQSAVSFAALAFSDDFL